MAATESETRTVVYLQLILTEAGLAVITSGPKPIPRTRGLNTARCLLPLMWTAIPIKPGDILKIYPARQLTNSKLLPPVLPSLLRQPHPPALPPPVRLQPPPPYAPPLPPQNQHQPPPPSQLH